MINSIRSKRILIFSIVMLAILAAAIFVIRQQSSRVVIRDTQGRAYAGTEACKSCHLSVYDSFITTPHMLTSAAATKKTVLGSFAGKDKTIIYNEHEKILVTDSADKLWQCAFLDNEQKLAHSFDISIGRGFLGQSYLYWQEKKLFQLPVSYIGPAKQWGNSPGFPDKILFTRTITPRCLECHTTYARTLSTPDLGYAFDEDAIIFGVTCERCHGPAADHVTFHTRHPEIKQAKYIINAARLGIQKQLDACAFCHSGQREALQPAFTFTTGDNLSNFYAPTYNKTAAENTDVHGNKYELITSSRCFIKSRQMTCSSCHNTHNNETDNLQLFSRRCMACHEPGTDAFCKAPHDNAMLQANCIDCHMPGQESKAISLGLSDNTKMNSSPAIVRTHLIKVYPEAYKRFMKTHAR